MALARSNLSTLHGRQERKNNIVSEPDALPGSEPATEEQVMDIAQRIANVTQEAGDEIPHGTVTKKNWTTHGEIVKIQVFTRRNGGFHVHGISFGKSTIAKDIPIQC